MLSTVTVWCWQTLWIYSRDFFKYAQDYQVSFIWPADPCEPGISDLFDPTWFQPWYLCMYLHTLLSFNISLGFYRYVCISVFLCELACIKINLIDLMLIHYDMLHIGIWVMLSCMISDHMYTCRYWSSCLKVFKQTC